MSHGPTTLVDMRFQVVVCYMVHCLDVYIGDLDFIFHFNICLYFCFRSVQQGPLFPVEPLPPPILQTLKLIYNSSVLKLSNSSLSKEITVFTSIFWIYRNSNPDLYFSVHLFIQFVPSLSSRYWYFTFSVTAYSINTLSNCLIFT